MEFKGKIKDLNHIVISDPTYNEDVWCRYEKNNLKEKDWLVNLDIYPVETKIDKFYVKSIDFTLLIQKNEKDCSLDDNGKLKYLKNIKLEKYTIGIDSACVALGINENAKEIINSQEEWQPPCAIKTGADGDFGTVFEGTKNGKLCFLLVTGSIEEEFINENELFDYLTNQFKIKELVKEDLTLHGNDRVLNKGDKVEVSDCLITNDVGGTTTIRNSKFKDEVEGMDVTMENFDGTTEHFILNSSDKLTNKPIVIEVLDSFYDYETGYHYKGKINDDKLVEEFRKFGTTGFKPGDYDRYKNKSMYEDALKANKKFNPSIVSFSEFDVIKVIEKSADNEMEL